MNPYPLSPYRSKLFLLFLLLLWSFCVATVAAAQGNNEPTAQAEDVMIYHLYLPTVISDQHNNSTDAMPPSTTDELADADAELLLEDVATVHSAAVTPIVDTTEDYKAVGYPDSRKIVRDAAGNFYIAYRKKFNNQYRIFVAKSTNQGASWVVLNGNQPVETIGAYTQRVPSIAIGRNAENNADVLHLVWYGNDSANLGNARQVKYIRLTADGKLSTDGCCTAAFTIAGYNGEALWQEHPTLYVNGSNVYIVWEGRDATNANSKIKFVRSTDFGRQWTQPLNINPAFPGNFSRPTLVVTYVGDKRQLYVAAYASANGISQVYWNRSLDNGDTWAIWQPIAAASVDQRHVSMARDKAGNLHMVWRQTTSDKSRTILRYRVYNPALKKGAGNWVSSAQTIASRSGQCLFFPSIAIGSNDRAWVVWTQSSTCLTVPNDNPTEGQIFYMSRPLSGKWGNPTALTSGGIHLYASLRSAPTPNSDTMDVVWLDGSQCAIEEPLSGQGRANDEADVAAVTVCAIRYTSVK